MSEEIVPSETTTETTTEPTPQESSNVDYDKLENDFLGITPQPETEEPAKPEEETTEEQKEETPEKYTFKADGQDVEVEGIDNLLEYARKGYTWDEKVKKLSEERKTYETEKESFTKERELIQLENLAYQIGGVQKEPVLDPYGDAYEKMVDKYGKEQADKYLETHEFISDTADHAYRQQQYLQWQRDAQTLMQNRESAVKQNEKNIEAFKTKYKIEDKDVTDIVKQMNSYIGYAVSKGQVPLPENAFEVFYRGMNFDTLLKSETEKLNADWEAKLKEEKEKLIEEFSGKKPKPKPAPLRPNNKPKTDKTWLDELEDKMVGIN